MRAVLGITTSVSRYRARSINTRCVRRTSWPGTTPARQFSRPPCWVRNLSSGQPVIIAITGAEATPKVNGEARPLNESFAVRADDRLTFDFMKVGARIYIAVAGGIDVPPILGSRSTYSLGALGGFSGRKLAAGDVLPVGKARSGGRTGRALAGDLVPTYPKSLELRVLTGLYFHRLTEEAARTFFEDTWTVAPEADRIGYRYRKGRALDLPRAEAAVRRRIRSLQHRRCRVSLRFDSSAGGP